MRCCCCVDSCQNGEPLSDGSCLCHLCWTGDLCDTWENLYPPVFDKSLVVVTPAMTPEPIYTATATDMDTERCGDCACAVVNYRLAAGNDLDLFRIDSETGQVFTTDDNLGAYLSFLDDQRQMKVTIVAFNPTDGGMETEPRTSEMTLAVSFPEELWSETVYSEDQPSAHSRRRRAITLPGNVTFTLTKTGNSQNITEMRVGTKISFQLQILFPQTTTDMLVELFAPDNDSIVMMLCDVQVQSIGPNLQHSRPGSIVMDSQNASNKFYDRAIIDFGNVTNSFADTNTELASSIVITWNAVMIQNVATVDQAVYWVSAGAEYNYEMEVWVGQASFTARTNADTTTFPDPMFNLSGPSSMQIGSSAIFTLDMFITTPSAGISVDVFAPLNNTNVMTVCDLQIVDTGTNYLCGFIPYEHQAAFFVDGNTRGYGRARLDLGTLTNKGSREPGNVMSANRITVQFVVHLYNDPSYVGLSYYVGAAVEIGSTQIWAGEILVTAAALNTAVAITPTWSVTLEGSKKVSTVTPLLMTLDITIPQLTTAAYALEVLAPFNDSAAVFQLCSVRMVDFGRNLPCTNSTLEPQYSARGSPLVTDRAYTSLGTLSNVGNWGYQPYNVTNPAALPPNVVRVQFMMTTTNHSLATVGSSHPVTLGLMINNNRLLVGTYNVEVDAPADLPNITDATTPNWTLSWVNGGGSVKVGGSGQFLVSMTTKPNTVYSPFDFEALMPNSTVSTDVAICKVLVHYAGKNLPCAIPKSINDSFIYTSLLGDGYNDRAVLNLPSLCNLPLVNDIREDVLALKVGFQVQPTANLTNGTDFWLSVGVMFSPYKMWVGQIKATARTDLVNTNLAPYVTVLMTTVGSVPVGFYVTYNVIIKSRPGDGVPYTVNVTANTGFSVCSLRLVQVGINMPCVNETVLEAVYEPDPVTGRNTRATLAIGTVSNTGSGSMTANSVVDDNSLVLELIVGLTPDTAVLANGLTTTFGTLLLTYGGTVLSPNPTIPSFTVTHNQTGVSVTASNVTKTEVQVAPISGGDNDSSVVLGQSKLLRLCTWTYPGSITSLTFNMLTPIELPGALEVTYAGLADAGRNLPCAGSCKAAVVTYQSRSGSSVTDVGTVNLGYVLNNNFDSDDPDANRVCVEGVFRLQKTSNLIPGSTVMASASINVNNVEITVLQLLLTVADNATFTDIYPENVTLSNGTLVAANASLPKPLCLYPGDVQTFPLLLYVPPNVTSVVDFDVKLDLDDSACMTYKDARLVSVGRNLLGFGKAGDLTCTPNSTLGTSQQDVVNCTFGVVTNPGISHRCGDFQAEDDVIYLEVDLQMADCRLAEVGVNLTASFGLKVASYIAILNYPVTVCRNGNEIPVFNVSALANSTGDVIFIDYDLRLDNASKAELRNASLLVTSPPYVNCSSLQALSPANSRPVLDTTSPNLFNIALGDVYFTDQIRLLLRCGPTSGYAVPSGVNGHNTVINHQMVGDIYQRAGSSLTSYTVWSDLDFVNVTVTTISKTGVTCTSAPLFLNDSRVVLDCQFNSSQPSLSLVTNGRKGGTGWQPYVRSGQLASQRYLQVYFPNATLVDRIEVDQNGPARALQLRVTYSSDGRSFIDGDTITLSSLAVETVQIPNPRESKVIRVYVTDQSDPRQRIGLRFEFYGCQTGSNGPYEQQSICDAANAVNQVSGQSLLFYHRSFLALTTGSVYVCDGVVLPKGTEKRCFYSSDGTVWQPLDERLASMVGHDPATNRLFALHQDGVAVMASKDLGLTWATVHSSILTAAQATPGYLLAKNVPWTDSVALPEGTPTVVMNAWGASYDGLKQTPGVWTSRINWACC